MWVIRWMKKPQPLVAAAWALLVGKGLAEGRWSFSAWCALWTLFVLAGVYVRLGDAEKQSEDRS